MEGGGDHFRSKKTDTEYENSVDWIFTVRDENNLKFVDKLFVHRVICRFF